MKVEAGITMLIAGGMLLAALILGGLGLLLFFLSFTALGRVPELLGAEDSGQERPVRVFAFALTFALFLLGIAAGLGLFAVKLL